MQVLIILVIFVGRLEIKGQLCHWSLNRGTLTYTRKCYSIVRKNKEEFNKVRLHYFWRRWGERRANIVL